MKPTSLLIIIALILGSCHNSNNQKTATTIADSNNAQLIDNGPTKGSLIKSDTINIANIKTHAFSDPIKKDTFKLRLYGKSLTDADVDFEIISFDKRTIFSEHFKSIDLIGDTPNDTSVSLKIKEETIKKRFADFFIDKAFHAPAIDKADQPDEDYSIMPEFNEIQINSSAIGFSYSYGYEGIYSIAYSKKQKKAVLYFSYN